jgi:prophage regulatory protein
MTHRILRLPEVMTRTGLSRSTIYLRISQDTLPKPVSLGGRAVGWVEAKIQEWLQRQIDTSRKQSDQARGNNHEK